MKPSRFLLVVAAVLALTLALSAQQPQTPVAFAADLDEVAVVGETAFRTGQVLVRLDGVADLAGARALLDGPRFAVVEALMPQIGLYLVALPAEARVHDAILELRQHPGVRHATPDHLVAVRGTVPNDPSYGSQWCHAIMGSDQAWDLGQGSRDFVVSVVDGGCLLTHADLAANLWSNAAEVSGTPGVDDDGNGYVDDLHGWNAYGNNGSVPNDGHGTHVNGIVGAVGNNGTGVAGINWRVSLMPVAGSSYSTSTVMKAYGYVLTQKELWLATGGAKGANVVATNSSFGIDYADCDSAAYLPWNDAYDAMGAVGILSCGATMNINANVDLTGDVPTGCSSDWVVSVTNTTNADTKNPGAAYGRNSIDLGAPGTNVYSTYSNGGYTNMTGTSMASPQVAGAIAFLHSVGSADFAALRAADPAAAALVVKQLLVDEVVPCADLNGKCVSGGRLSARDAGQVLANWSSGASPWVDLGGGTTGVLGEPSLVMSGALTPGSTLALELTKGSPLSLALLFIAFDSSPISWIGGTLYAFPYDELVLLGTDASGILGGTAVFPGAASGTQLWFQMGIEDATAAPHGATLSNAQVGTVP